MLRGSILFAILGLSAAAFSKVAAVSSSANVQPGVDCLAVIAHLQEFVAGHPERIIVLISPGPDGKPPITRVPGTQECSLDDINVIQRLV
jgi:hypothetical protein